MFFVEHKCSPWWDNVFFNKYVTYVWSRRVFLRFARVQKSKFQRTGSCKASRLCSSQHLQQDVHLARHFSFLNEKIRENEFALVLQRKDNALPCEQHVAALTSPIHEACHLHYDHIHIPSGCGTQYVRRTTKHHEDHHCEENDASQENKCGPILVECPLILMRLFAFLV